MAYRGSSSERLMLIDVGGEKVGVYYRSPTPSEYIGYHNEKLAFRGGKVESRLVETNIKYGLKVITGVRAGDLEYREGGQWKPLDTDAVPEPEWKAVLERDFFELVDFVGSRVFNPVEGPGDAGEPAAEEAAQKK